MKGTSLRTTRTAGLILMASVISLGCASGPGRTTIVTASPRQTFVPASRPATLPARTPAPPAVTPTSPERTPPPIGGTLPRELVGIWTQDEGAGSTFYFIRREYRFGADGTYALIDGLCSQDSNGTRCQPDDSPEAGVASVNGNVLRLSPTTASDDGPRAIQFAVVFDDVTQANRLQFFTPAYTDEWYWVQP